MPTFVFGVLIYHLYRITNFNEARRFGVGHFLVAAVGVAIVSISYGVMSIGPFEGLTVEAALYGVLLIGPAIAAPGFLVNRITCFYGKISYSVYLSHATTFFFLSKIFAQIYAHIPYVTVAYSLSVAMGLLIVTLLSYLTFRFIEAPGNKLGRTIIKLRMAGASRAVS